MLAWPLESLATLTMVVGIWLIVIGVFEIVSAFGIRKASKRLGGDNARARARRVGELTHTDFYYALS